MLPPVNTRTTCRLCSSKALVDLFSLGNIFVSNFASSFADAYDEKKYPKAPLNLLLCKDCTLVQLEHTVTSELLYTGNYWYKSGTTETMRVALARVAVEACNRVTLVPGDVVLDIGSNDGTLLSNFPRNLVRLGCEPAKNLATEENYSRRSLGCINELWSAELFRKCFDSTAGKIVYNMPGVLAKVVTALGMLYDLEDPDKFVADIAEVLHPNGVFIAQLMCLSDMIEMNDVGNICHEHLEYYSYESIAYLFEKNELEIFDVERNAVNGRSTRFYCRKVKEGRAVVHCDTVYQMIAEEERKSYTPGIEDTNEEKSKLPVVLSFYKNLRQQWSNNANQADRFIAEAIDQGKSVYVYGASTKGNTILQWYGLDHHILNGACDKNPAKHGKFTVGTGILIESEEAVRARNPDYFLVLPYTFLQEFIVREREFLERGGKFIVPLPEFRVIGKEILSMEKT